MSRQTSDREPTSPLVWAALGITAAAVGGTLWLVLRPAPVEPPPAPEVIDAGPPAPVARPRPPDAGRPPEPEIACTATWIYRERAERAEVARDWPAALEAWERVLDRCPSSEEERVEARLRAAALREKVPADDPERGRPWRVLAVIIQRVDLSWTDDERDYTVRAEMSDENQEQVRAAMASFEKQVGQATSGRVRIAWRLALAPEPQTQFEQEGPAGPFWSTPGTLVPSTEAARANEEFDSMFVYLKLQESSGGDRVPTPHEVQTLDPSHGPQGAFWTSFAVRVEHPTDGEAELREWLGQVEWRLTHRPGFARATLPSPLDAADPDYAPLPGEASRLRYYHHLMRDHVTRRVWTEVARAR